MRAVAKLTLTLLICWGVILVYAKVSDVQVIYSRAQAIDNFNALAAEAAQTLADSQDPIERELVRRELVIAMDQLRTQLDTAKIAELRVNAR